MRIDLPTGALVAALAAGACGTALRAGATAAPDTDFTRYATFAWDDADDFPTGDPRLDNNALFVHRLHLAIEAQLAARGIRRVEEDPDLVVHHHLAVRDRVEVFEVDRRRGYEDPSGHGPGTGVYQYEEGTFLVDIADAETLTMVWRGWAQTDIEAGLSDPQRLVELTDAAVARMFESFPRPVQPRVAEPRGGAVR